MELARAERALNRPKNWGEITYKNIKKREEDRENGLLPILPPSIKVRAVLETQPIVTGTLDGSEAITELLEDEQCDFFSRYSQCRGFVLRNWSFVAHKVLRCISISFAESLVELDLSDSAVNSTHLEVLLVRTTALKILKLNNCPLINTAAILILVKLLSPTLIELYLSRCAQVSTDPLLWIGGVAGFKTNSLSKLKLLDLSEDPIEDRGLIAIAEGCKRIVFLNLFNCDRVTDVSIIAIAQSCKHLTIVNLAGCQLLTSKAIVAIGKNCHELISINISRCTLVSDKAVQALAKGCSHLQACNLAGLLKLSEEAIFYLADHCKGLLMLNLTGCEKITVNGLNALISGLPCVEKGITFMGFKPIDQHIEHKLAGHLLTMERSAIKLIREGQVKKKKKKEEQEFIISNRLNHAATLIQQYIKRYTMRLRFYRIWQKKLGTRCAIFIQRIQRGINGRKYAKFLKQKRETFLALSPYALLIQKNVRGYLCRIFNPQVSRSIREMYLLRRQEIEAAIAVRLQSHMRKYLGKKKVEIYKELRLRRDQNVYDAILSMQLLARRYISKIILLRKKLAKQSYDEAKRIAGMKIKLFCVDGMRRYKSRLTGSALRKFYREKWTGSELIQKVYRGFKGRESAHQLKIQLAVKHYAATLIQRVFRGSRILYWRDMRLNVVAAYVLDRQYLERRVSIEASRLRYQQFLKENRCDSASEPDDEDEEQEYIKTYDAAKKMYYWQNYVSGEIFYDEPLDPLAHEKSLIGRRVKVYWIVQGAWYEGSITNYHKRKKRHRVDYDDGDHEWVNLLNECDRVQVQLDDGSWAMYLMYQSDAMLDEQRKKEEKKKRDDYKLQAFEDAHQWNLISEENAEKLIFLSNKTGEIRTGLPNALDWVVQDDGYGFPCFANKLNGMVVYEEPRFLDDVDEDIDAQRKYVMQELRLATYMCRDYWENYSKLVSLGDNRQIDVYALQVRNSAKCRHLDSFLIRAKALYQQKSVVDKPISQSVIEELDYASWLAERISEIIERAEIFLSKKKDVKSLTLGKFSSAHKDKVFCRYCTRETKRHLEYCPTCGKPQVFID